MIWETFWRHDRSGKPGCGRVTEPPNKNSSQNRKPEKPEIIETGETGNRDFKSAAETVHNPTGPKVSCATHVERGRAAAFCYSSVVAAVSFSDDSDAMRESANDPR